MFVAPLTAAAKRLSGSPVLLRPRALTTSSTSARSPNASRKATIDASGFLRSKPESNAKAVNTLSFLGSVRWRCVGVNDVATGYGTTRTGALHPAVLIVSWTNREGAHTSWTSRKADRQVLGNVSNSQTQHP